MGSNILKDDISMNEELSVFQHNKDVGCSSSQSETDQKHKSLNPRFKKARLQDHEELGIFIIVTTTSGPLHWRDEHHS